MPHKERVYLSSELLMPRYEYISSNLRMRTRKIRANSSWKKLKFLPNDCSI